MTTRLHHNRIVVRAALFIGALAWIASGTQASAQIADSVPTLDSTHTMDSAQAVPLKVAPDSTEWIAHVTANSSEETYLRYLQVTGAVRLYPWSLRGFSLSESQRLSARVGTHPWSRSTTFVSAGQRVRLLPAAAEVRGNSAFPYGSNDGPVWAGRGLTASASLGVSVRAGPISLVLAPMVFVAQNAEFELLDNGQSRDGRFADGLSPGAVDRPQRFGERAYGRVDPGNSTLRADIGFVAAGVSTANMTWGPFEHYPFILGTNAPGFLHGFLGTSRPLSIWVGSLHGRVIWGRLEQSEYSPVSGAPTYVSPTDPGTRRFGSGMVLVFEPRGVRGLELGIARFFHSPWPQSGIPASYFRKPFENILKKGLETAPGFSDAGSSADNQLISGFVRWAFSSVGFEMYAEYGREDHSWDLRDFVQEPDHSRSYGLGFRKALLVRPERMEGLTVEIISFQLPHLARTSRGEGGIYTHGVMRQGHTNRGQLLGADVGAGEAAGSIVRWDVYYPSGRRSLALQRKVRGERGSFHETGGIDPDSPDVQYSLSAERLRRFGKFELEMGVALIHEFNRNFGGSATAASAVAGVRVPLGR